MSSMENIRRIRRETRERNKIEDAQFEKIINEIIDQSRFEDEEVEDQEA